jgi:hypothetical protein
LSPSRGVKPANWARPRNITARTWAPSSLRVKYQWPEAARVKLEISPAIQVRGNERSSRRATAWFRALTVSTGGAAKPLSVGVSFIIWQGKEASCPHIIGEVMLMSYIAQNNKFYF